MLQKKEDNMPISKKPAIQISSTILGGENKSRYLNGLATHGKLKEATSMACNDLTLFFSCYIYICINHGATSSPVSLVE